MSAIDILKAEVAAVETVEGSAITLIGNLRDRLMAALSGQNGDNAKLADVEAVISDLDQHKQALAAAVSANTPVDTSVVVGTGVDTGESALVTATTGQGDAGGTTVTSSGTTTGQVDTSMTDTTGTGGATGEPVAGDGSNGATDGGFGVTGANTEEKGTEHETGLDSTLNGNPSGA